jgi:immune inhibitor A
MKNRLAAILVALTVFSASSTSVIASIVFPYSGDYAWHSGQGNDLYNRLTQDFTLSGSSPELTFWTWYDMESNWDYGYVTISTDGGSTWTALAGNITTSSNPNGENPYGGAGITGASGTWIQAQFDLSAYAGVVKIGFEYDTNSSVVSTGWLIDDIELTGYPLDDVESGEGGWSKNPTNGWRRIDRVQEIPEPSTIAIWSLLGLAGLGYGWRKHRKAA